jgi:hypothetical protein
MEEVHSSESAGDQREYVLAVQIDLRLDTSVRKYISMAELTERKFDIVGVGAKILHTMKTLTKASKRLSKIFVPTTLSGWTMRIHAAIMNRAGKREFDVAGRSGPITSFVGNVIFHSGLGVDCELIIADRWA